MGALLIADFEYIEGSAEDAVNTVACRELCLEQARQMLEIGQSIAPVRTGRYRDSMSAQIEEGEEPKASLTVDVPYWAYVEYGTIHMEGEHILENAARAVSHTFEVT